MAVVVSEPLSLVSSGSLRKAERVVMPKMSEKSSSPSDSANLVISTVERARRTGGIWLVLLALSGGGRAGREEGLERRVLLPLVAEEWEDLGTLVVRSEGWKSWGASWGWSIWGVCFGGGRRLAGVPCSSDSASCQRHGRCRQTGPSSRRWTARGR